MTHQASSTGRAVTRREAEVLALVGERLHNDEIAARLHLSVRTVESHVSSLLRKLGAPDRRALLDLIPQQAAAGRRGLPRPLSSFVGRESDVQRLGSLLDRHRLVTITGPGGVGKSRLALVLAERHRPAVFIDLLTVRPDGSVDRTIADALGVHGDVGGLREAVQRQLTDPRLLVVLDNCEHVRGPTTQVLTEVLPPDGARVLATSREPLALSGEVVCAIEPLPLDEAMVLFNQRAAAALPGFEGAVEDEAVVASICAQLDGLPLAIELAAARVRAFSPAELRRRLDDGLAVLSGGPPGRHHTLEAALQWSHDLLDDTERLVLERCSVFPGSFTYDDGAAVVVYPPLEPSDFARAFPRLLDRSLISVRRSRATSYHLLDSVRRFSADRLRLRGEQGIARERHARHHVAEAVRRADALRGAGQPAALEWFAERWTDLRAAVDWALANDPDLVPTLVGGVGTAWEVHGARAEVFEWLAAAGAAVDRAGPRELAGLAVLLCYTDAPRAGRLARRALSEAVSPQDRALALLASGWTHAYSARDAEAVACLREAAAEFGRLGDRWHEALARQTYGPALPDPGLALAELRGAADAYAALGDRVKRANSLNIMGHLAARTGVELESARAWLAESAELAREVGSEHERLHAALFSAVLNMRPDMSAGLAGGLGDQLEELAAGFERVGDRRCVARSWRARAEVALRHGQPPDSWLERGLTEARAVGDARLVELAQQLGREGA